MALFAGTDHHLQRFAIGWGNEVAQMTSADQYRIKAVECTALALSEPHQHARSELEILAKAYRRLSELADRNSRTDIVYEPPFPRPQLHH